MTKTKPDRHAQLVPLMIRQARKHLRLTQKQFGELVGVRSYATIWAWEADPSIANSRTPRGTTWKYTLMMLEKQGITFDEEGILIADKSSTKRDKAKSAA